ncbi:MAG: signal peptidase II [Gammaproteobacteria bacterium]|nr:signal peptidase II [Gammaproteobacteria bacterium]
MILSKKHLWIVIAILVFAIDRFTKSMVLDNLILEEPVNVFPMLNLFFTFNPGAAFSFLNKASGWQEWLFGGIAVGVSIFLVIWEFKIPVKDLWLKIALALVLGGTLGNLYDRVVYHKVVDFIDFYFKQWHYPAFNIADAAICIGAFMLIIDIMRKEKHKKV